LVKNHLYKYDDYGNIKSVACWGHRSRFMR